MNGDLKERKEGAGEASGNGARDSRERGRDLRRRSNRLHDLAQLKLLEAGTRKHIARLGLRKKAQVVDAHDALLAEGESESSAGVG